MHYEVRKAIVRESNGLRGTKCFGCMGVEVLQRRKFRKVEEVYWCESLHSYINPKKVKCPLAGD